MVNGLAPATGTVGGQTVSSPCAGCKFLRRKCQPDCVFAPYFPPDEPQKFVNVHRVFGASNVTKILNELHPIQREDAVNSLAYEAEMRLRDPVYGCVGIISLLQHKLRQVQIDLSRARSELCKYQAAAAAAGMDQLLVPACQHQQQQNQQQQQQRMMMMRGYTAAAEVGGGTTVYDSGLITAAFGGPFARYSNAAGGDDRHATLGSS
ncbi:LOB domain-containing protein 6 [Platanthera zijinensis]|uniref:LOB domain-containing protein 6 n=1 Tax=Platanthera zijinensis TaxID=2320716 RepID=A0AAP0GBU7_9ASPA